MVDGFLSFIESNNIAIRESKTLLAVSGGIDSVAMVHLFINLNLDFGIAHCNFNLRGNESDGDEKFVKKLAKTLNKPFHNKSFETEAYAKANGISIQMAARELRYSWFNEMKNEFHYDLISTAHHQGDVVETILFNLTKGTGLEGLKGIIPVRNNLIRPLLFASRNEIENYARKNNILWREDSSNKSTKYSRNKIRHSVIPILEEINPKAQSAIYSSGNKIKEAELFLKHCIDTLDKDLVKIENESTFINIKLLKNTPGYKYVLYQTLKPFGFNYLDVNSIAKKFGGISGKLFYSQTHVANVDRGNLIVSPVSSNMDNDFVQEEGGDLEVNNKLLSARIIKNEDYKIKENNSILAFDKAKLQFPLEIRNWRQGDTFRPLGMKGKKKISDFMIDAKIPVNFKNKIKVIVSNGDIVAILEHRLDDRFKITKNTKEVFEITCR